MSIAIVRATHPCISGSRILASRMSNISSGKMELASACFTNRRTTNISQHWTKVSHWKLRIEDLRLNISLIFLFYLCPQIFISDVQFAILVDRPSTFYAWSKDSCKILRTLQIVLLVRTATMQRASSRLCPIPQMGLLLTHTFRFAGPKGLCKLFFHNLIFEVLDAQ